MKKKLCLFLLCLTFLACGKEVIKEEIDEHQLQERNGIFYKINEQKGFTGIITKKYSNGQFQLEVNSKDGKLDGLTKMYYENGQAEREMNYKNGQLDGLAKTYYRNGQVKSEENYKDGQLDGVGRSHYPSGRIKTYYYVETDVLENYEDEPLDFQALMKSCKEIEELIKNSLGDNVWEFSDYLIPHLEGYSYSNNLTTKEVMELNLLEAEINRINETYFKK